MRRLPSLLAFAVVFALLVVAAATAAPPTDFCDRPGNEDHPKCSTDSFPDCVFDASTGVLNGWDGTGDPYRCEWTPEDANAEISFQIQSETVATVKLPQLTVNAEPKTPSAICFNEWRNRPQLVPFPPNGDPLWTFTPADKPGCADDGPYLLAIRVNPVKKGTVELVMEPPGDIPPITQGS